jgi:hypothetical protein
VLYTPGFATAHSTQRNRALLADVRGALGPCLNVFLFTQYCWSQSEAGPVATIGGLLGMVIQT